MEQPAPISAKLSFALAGLWEVSLKDEYRASNLE